MTPLPPIHDLRPPRRTASGRSAVPCLAAVLACVLLVAGGCAVPVAPSPSPSPSIAPPQTSAAPPPSVDGLLVAAGGALQVSDGAVLSPFDAPDDAIVEVVASRGVVVIVDRAGGIRVSAPPGAGRRSWRVLTMPSGIRTQPGLLGLSPAATTVALAAGDLQGRSFALVLLDVASGRARSIDVARGLDGPPTWIGPGSVAVHAIRDDQTSGFSQVDVVSGDVTDIPSYGVALAATADGRAIAIDEATTGDVLAGDRTDVNDAGVDRLTRLANPSGGGVERLALSADGRRLAVVRRTDTGSAIERFAMVGAAWALVDALSIEGDRAVSIAWLE